jgi:hypothetical protein
MFYARYPLSYRQVEDILHERGIDMGLLRPKVTVQSAVGAEGTPYYRAPRLGPRPFTISVLKSFGGDFVWGQRALAYYRLPQSVPNRLRDPPKACLIVDPAARSPCNTRWSGDAVYLAATATAPRTKVRG